VSFVVQSLEESLGKRIKYLRKKNEMTQAQLAESSGLTDRHIRNLEKGERWPESATIAKLCTGLNTTIRDLFDFDYP